MTPMTSTETSNLRRRLSVPLSILLVAVIWSLGASAAFGQTQTIYCASEDGRRSTCSVDTRGGVRLLERKSEKACQEGRSWGYSRDYIWVDRGCRADFEVGASDYRRDGRDRDRGRYSHGSVTWTGKVNHDVKLIISGSRMELFVQSGKDLGPGRSYFTAPMPRDAFVTVRRIKGRNDVYVTDQPSRRNDYSAVIRITDSKGGNDDTEVIISW